MQRRCKVSFAGQYLCLHKNAGVGDRVGCASARTQHPRALFETPFPLRFGIAHPGRPKLRHDIPVVSALPTKTSALQIVRLFVLNEIHFRTANREVGGRLRAHRKCAPKPVGQTARLKARESRGCALATSRRAPTPTAPWELKC